MPPLKIRPTQPEDSRSDGSIPRERSTMMSAVSRKSKHGNGTSMGKDTGSTLKELALISTESGDVVTPGQSTGMNWSTVPLEMLDNYRLAYQIHSPAAFTSPLHQALLTNNGLGRHSPTMARRKERRRVPRDQLATNVRKHFNSAAVSEIEIVVELAYKTRHQDKQFRMRSAPPGVKKA